MRRRTRLRRATAVSRTRSRRTECTPTATRSSSSPVRTPRSTARTAGSFARAATFTNISSQCATRGLAGTSLATCQQLLSAVPSNINSLNAGAVDAAVPEPVRCPRRPEPPPGRDAGQRHLRWGRRCRHMAAGSSTATAGSPVSAPPTRRCGSTRSPRTFHDVNFQNGDSDASGSSSAVRLRPPRPGGAQFYSPIIADPNPAAAGTIFEGLPERLADAGLGRRAGIPRSELPRVLDVGR